MWLNPKFKVQVVKFVYDELIKQRHDSGDNYLLLTKSLAKIVSKPFLVIAIQNIAKAINHIIFNKHNTGIRNSEASEESLRELAKLEFKLAELISEVFIKNCEEATSYLRKQWNNKYLPKLLNISA